MTRARWLYFHFDRCFQRGRGWTVTLIIIARRDLMLPSERGQYVLAALGVDGWLDWGCRPQLRWWSDVDLIATRLADPAFASPAPLPSRRGDDV